MQKEHLSFLGNQTPRPELETAILTAVAIERRREARVHATIATFIACVALTLLVPFGRALRAEWYLSETYQFFSLLFTDGALLFSYWREYSWSLLESFPFSSVTMVLSVVLVLVASVRFMARSVPTAFLKIKYS